MNATLTGLGTSTLRSVALVLGIPRLMVIASTGLGTVNTTERCTRPRNPPLVPIGGTQCEHNVESYGIPMLSKKRFVRLRMSLHLAVGFEVAGVCLL